MVNKHKSKYKPFRSAREEVKEISQEFDTPQTQSDSYKIAFTDTKFLLREELRPIRLQLELLKPEMTLAEQHIHSTVVIFGSARIPEKSISQQRLDLIEEALAEAPDDVALQRKSKIAKSIVEKSKYYDEARRLATIISDKCQKNDKREFVVVTGGGPGIMEAANRGAHDIEGKSIGLNIVLPLEQGPNPYITPDLCFQFHYFAIRKMHFLIRARALVAFPGGYGTLDELFEALTLLQTRKIDRIPVLLFGKEYWSKVINFEAMREEGVIDHDDLSFFQYVETAEEAWDVIANFHHLSPASCEKS